MIKINRIDKGNICEEYISRNEILSCQKIKVVDKKASPNCVPCFISPDKALYLKKIDDYHSFGQTAYKDSDDVTYVYLEDRYGMYDWNQEKTPTQLMPGWNRVDVIPEVSHEEYWIEVPNTKTIGTIERNSYWFTEDRKVELDSPRKRIRIDEETYNRIINTDSNENVVSNGH